MLASSYIEEAKGRIAARIAADNMALHPRADWKDHPPINNLDDLQIFLTNDPVSDPLNVVNVRHGNRFVFMQVYDLTYSPIDSITGISVDQIQNLPPPLNMEERANNEGGRFTGAGENEGGGSETNTGDFKPDPLGSGPNLLTLDDLGAYLIRVELRDTDNRVIRTTEEAFFILARDIAIVPPQGP